MQRDLRAYLFDIEQACQLLEEFTNNKGIADYLADPMLRSAVERQFEIIGEALNQALRLSPDLGTQISNIRRIISFRNRLIHGYAVISHEVVWGLIETHLPILHQELSSLLATLSEE